VEFMTDHAAGNGMIRYGPMIARPGASMTGRSGVCDSWC